MEHSKIKHDLWSAYNYNGKIKVIYLKALPQNKEKFSLYPIYPELADIPPQYREIAVKAIIHNGTVLGEAKPTYHPPSLNEKVKLG